MICGKQQLVEWAEHRRQAAVRGEIARASGYITLAENYDRIVAEWDVMLSNNGVTPERPNRLLAGRPSG